MRKKLGGEIFMSLEKKAKEAKEKMCLFYLTSFWTVITRMKGTVFYTQWSPTISLL